VLRTALAAGRDGLLRMGEAAQRLSEVWSTEASAKAIAAAAMRACAARAVA
jgi:hypothetical protein